MLVIVNYSGENTIKELNEEKSFLYEKNQVKDYFDYNENKEEFLLVHYTEGTKAVVAFYNFNFASKDFDMNKDNVKAILDYFGIKESFDKEIRGINYSKLLESKSFVFASIFTEGKRQTLDTPNWYYEKFE